MYKELKKINHKPEPFEVYTAATLWTDDHISKKMLEYHLNQDVDAASRKKVFIDSSVEWMTSFFNIGATTKICDFGCGPGLYCTQFAERGALVTGVDFSASSIEYACNTAAKKNLDVEYVQQNYLEYETDKKFDLITMIMCDFCALSPTQRMKLLSKFHQYLSENGTVILDAYTLSAFAQRDESASYEHLQLNGFWSASDYYGFVNIFKYEDEKVVLDKYTIVEENQTWEVYNWLQYFSKKSITKEFEAAGFRIDEFYADVAGRPYDEEFSEFAVVAKKAG
ncbi:MAG: class I SAM-dependent methyltransferase [Candidatus Latescibacteria bacterium]|nr:class I SAM-dependent methyltransferase [Candidatus Latescibacterota bacterium]